MRSYYSGKAYDRMKGKLSVGRDTCTLTQTHYKDPAGYAWTEAPLKSTVSFTKTTETIVLSGFVAGSEWNGTWTKSEK